MEVGAVEGGGGALPRLRVGSRFDTEIHFIGCASAFRGAKALTCRPRDGCVRELLGTVDKTSHESHDALDDGLCGPVQAPVAFPLKYRRRGRVQWRSAAGETAIRKVDRFDHPIGAVPPQMRQPTARLLAHWPGAKAGDTAGTEVQWRRFAWDLTPKRRRGVPGVRRQCSHAFNRIWSTH